MNVLKFCHVLRNKVFANSHWKVAKEGDKRVRAEYILPIVFSDSYYATSSGRYNNYGHIQLMQMQKMQMNTFQPPIGF